MVTGASRGIGRTLAIALAEAGADVACNATEAANAHETVAAILKLGRKAVAVGARVENAQQVAAMVKRTADELGPIDILVNNAGISRPKPVLDMTEADWDEIMDVNAKSVFLCAQAVAKQLRDRKAPGAILNLGSIAGVNGFPRRLTYCASKAAIHHMTRVMAIEWAALHIRVNCLAPGYIYSDNTEGLAKQGLLDLGAIQRRVPMGDLGRAEDLTAAAVYMVSEEARYMTGSVVTIDGGWDAYGFTLS